MHNSLLLCGASALALVAAAPAEAPWGGWQPTSGTPTYTSPSAPAQVQTTTGPSTSSGSSAAGAQLKSGNPFSYPLGNGFPNLDTASKQQVSNLAHGIEPDSGAPTLDADDLISFQLIAFNEIFEVAFFTDLLFNVTNDVAGFAISNATEKQTMINALTAIQAQEELHADNANAILKANNVDPIQPCQYKFPTTSIADALALAMTFTDVVLGTLQDVQLHLAMNAAKGAKTAGVVPIIGSVIGQEGEQTGFFRNFNGLIPSSKPFLTRAAREFAFSALNQNFVVAGSCPNSRTIPLPFFTALTITTSKVLPQDQTLSFSVPVTGNTLTGTQVAFINGQQTPILQPVKNVQVANGVATFQADFPFTATVMDGLTIAALTTANTTAVTVAADIVPITIAGPGLIEIN